MLRLPAHPPYTPLFFFFFFNATASTEIYTLSLHDALPIFLMLSTILRVWTPSAYSRLSRMKRILRWFLWIQRLLLPQSRSLQDRKSTRLNSSHVRISYAVFCLKKKKNNNNTNHIQ